MMAIFVVQKLSWWLDDEPSKEFGLEKWPTYHSRVDFYNLLIDCLVSLVCLDSWDCALSSIISLQTSLKLDSDILLSLIFLVWLEQSFFPPTTKVCLQMWEARANK